MLKMSKCILYKSMLSCVEFNDQFFPICLINVIINMQTKYYEEKQ